MIFSYNNQLRIMKILFESNLINFFKIITFAVLITSSFNAQGQENVKQDYIVSIQGDTLRGKVKFKSDSQLILSDANSGGKTYGPEEIKAAYDKGNYYSVENVMGTKKFLHQVIIGNTSLYQFKLPTSKEQFYLKLNDTVLAVTKNLFPGISNFLVSQCKETNYTTGTVPNLNYSLSGLSALVIYYNTCKGFGDTQVVKYVPKKIQLKPQVYLGADMSRFKYGEKSRNNAEDEFETGLGFVAGVSVKLGNDTGLSFRPGLQFSHKSASVKNLPVPINNTTTVDLALSVNFIEVPLLFRYSFKGKNFRPFIALGPHVGTAFLSDIERTPHRFSYYEGYEEDSKFEMKYGILGEAGVYFNDILKGMEVKLRAEKSYYENDMDLEYLQNSSLQLLIGFNINK